MNTKNILQSELIDIIFDGRNKDYGAYELRRNYAKRIRNAMLITSGVLFLVVGGTVLANSSNGNHARIDDRDEVFLTQVDETTKIEPPKPEPKPAIEEPKVKTEIFTAPKILEDELVKNEMPPVDVLDSAKIDVVKRDGTPDVGIVDPGPIDGGKKIIDVIKTPVDDGPLVTVDLDAKFNGDWRRFLERNLVAEVPINNDAPAGRYPVEVKFVVDVEGHVSDIVALTRHGYGMEEEAIRVIRKSARWEPAIFSGRPVKAYRRQMITFIVEKEE